MNLTLDGCSLTPDRPEPFQSRSFYWLSMKSRRKRYLVWATFFATPIVVLYILIWPKIPDLPIRYWNWDLSIQNSNPQQSGYSGVWIRGPQLVKGMRSTHSTTEGTEQTYVELHYLGVTGNDAVFEVTMMAQTHDGTDWQTKRSGTVLHKVPLGGTIKTEVWPGVVVVGEFQDSKTAWKDQWERWKEILKHDFR